MLQRFVYCLSHLIYIRKVVNEPNCDVNKGVDSVYKTECFLSSEGKVFTYTKYYKWLKEIQNKSEIEVIAVTGLDTLLVVTYREVK
jgi:hypothetical protein